MVDSCEEFRLVLPPKLMTTKISSFCLFSWLLIPLSSIYFFTYFFILFFFYVFFENVGKGFSWVQPKHFSFLWMKKTSSAYPLLLERFTKTRKMKMDLSTWYMHHKKPLVPWMYSLHILIWHGTNSLLMYSCVN